MVAPEAPDDLTLPVERRPFAPADLEGAWLVLTCTGVVDDQVARSDDHSQSDAWVPAVARVEEVVVSVTSGRNPRRSVALRDEVVAHWRELDKGKP